MEVATIIFDGPEEDMNIAEITLCEALQANKAVVKNVEKRTGVKPKAATSGTRTPWTREVPMAMTRRMKGTTTATGSARQDFSSELAHSQDTHCGLPRGTHHRVLALSSQSGAVRRPSARC